MWRFEDINYAIASTEDKTEMFLDYSELLKMDCSQLSRHAYTAAGVSLPRTSVEQAKYCYNNGYMIGAGELQPGDLVFWTKNSCSCGRWNEIHHVGVFIGNGRIVDASSSKGRVILRNLWSSSNWVIFGYARPHIWEPGLYDPQNKA